MDLHLQHLLRDAVRNSRKVRFVALEDACSVCHMLDSRVFDPTIAPIIPVKGCENQVCRCDYRPVSN